MEQQARQAVALMRYSAISPLVSGQAADYPSKTAFFRSVSEKGILTPGGETKHFSPETIERWYSLYAKGGFDALLPADRADCGKSRKIDSDLFERIRHYHLNYPRMPAAAIHRKLISDGCVKHGQISESSVLRCVNQINGTEKLPDGTDMHRYERPHINEVWCGDSCYGPYLKTDDGKKHRVYVIALIDDASRFITGADVFFSDCFINLMSVLKSAVSKFGVPSTLCFDNGHTYKNLQMELLAARIGSVVHYCHPYTPTQKAKIERWFGTLRSQWMSSLDMRDFHSLDEVRGSLFAYVNAYNQRVHSSLNGKSPSDRFFSEPEKIRRLSEDMIEKSFLLETERRVSPDSVIVIDNTEYEVDSRFAKQRIRFRYTPAMDRIFAVEQDDTLTPVRILNKHDNAVMKRERVFLSRGTDND